MTCSVEDVGECAPVADQESNFSQPTALVLASGKGGVGKSVLTVLLGSILAREGHRVLLFDGSQNLGNLHVLLGDTPVNNLEEVLSGEIDPEAVIRSVGPNLWLLPSDSGADSLYALDAVARARLHYRLSTLYDRFDTVIIDSGPGIDDVVRLCTMRATGLVVVTVAEPTALTDAYALIKIVTHRVPGLTVNVLVNHARSEVEARAAFDRLTTATRQFLQLDLEYLGAVPEDASLQLAVRQPGRLKQWQSTSPAAQALQTHVAAQQALFVCSKGSHTVGREVL
jgi:flagellar biosynthesis protein FlhG